MTMAESLRARVEGLTFRVGRKDLPVIVQTEMGDCGLACLAMISGFYGHRVDLSYLKRTYSISSSGTSLRAIKDIANDLHLTSRAIRLEVSELKFLSTPCILHWKMDHFVVLKSVQSNHITIHDPAIGRVKVPVKEVFDLFTGVAVEFFPSESFVKGDSTSKLRIRDLWSRSEGIKRSIFFLVALSIVLQVLALIAPLYVQVIVDDVLISENRGVLTALAIGFSLLLALEVVTTGVRRFLVLRLSSWLGIQMSSNVFRHLIKLPTAYFARRHMGDILSRFSSLNEIKQFLTTGVALAIVDGMLALTTLIVMLIYSVWLTSIVVLVLLMYLAVRLVTFQSYKKVAEESILAAADENTHFMESIRAIQPIKIFQKEDDRHSRWLNKLAASTNKSIGLEKWNISYALTSAFFFGYENILVIYMAAIMVMDGNFSLGMLFAFLQFKMRFVRSVDSLVHRLIEFRMINLHLERLSDIAFEEADECSLDKGAFRRISGLGSNPLSIIGKVSVRSLTFRFSENEPYIFRNISFDVDAGSIVAIVGPSGGGKTTMLKVMMGLLAPTEGKVLIDGKSIRDSVEYRREIASVMQEDCLISGDLAENISCFDPEFDMERVIWAANMACIHETIMSMPMQYNTLVGDMGSTLSGGQKQRVVLARALYRKPKVLFMDEATSHLDVKTERLVNENIATLNITRIMVAHRPETVRFADKLIEIDLVN